jgi:hypothetical protein
MELTYRTMLTKSTHSITDNESIKITYRRNRRAAGYLMNMCLKEGKSVIVYSNEGSYYEHVFLNCPPAVRMFDEESLREDIMWPYIKDAEDKVAKTMEELLILYDIPTPTYPEGEKEQPYPDPNMEQCFYQIKPTHDGNNILVETYFTGLLYQRRCIEPMKEICLFIDAPFVLNTPVLRDNFTKLTRGMRIIKMYESAAEDIGSTYELYSDGDEINCIYMGKERKLYEQNQ